MLLPMCHWFVALQHIFYDNYFVSTDCFIKNYSKITRARGQNKHKVSEGTGGDLRVFLVRSSSAASKPVSSYGGNAGFQLGKHFEKKCVIPTNLNKLHNYNSNTSRFIK